MEHAEKLEALGKRLEELMEEHRVPGVAVGLIIDGEEHIITRGVTSRENPLPITEDTLFQIGSTTKTITATALVHLEQQGKVDLSAPVRRYIPELKLKDPSALEQVTVQDLLTHTAGWVGDHFLDTGDGDDALSRYVESMAEIPQLTPPGTVWSYNNASFCLAGLVIEKVTGATYEAAIEDLVLNPLGMELSCFFPKDVMIRRFVVGHIVQDDKESIIAQPWPIPRSANAAGGLSSSVREQLRYARFHMGDGRNDKGEQVLRPENVRRMQAPIIDAAEEQLMGLSWMLRDEGGIRFVAHGGSTNGQQSAFWMVPERRFALTVLTNADRGSSLHDQLSEWVREHFLGVKRQVPKPLDLSADELAQYAGRYVQVATGGAWELRLEGEKLMLYYHLGDMSQFTKTPPPPPPPMPVGIYAQDRMVILDGRFKGFRAEFLRDELGRIAWLRMGYRIHPPAPAASA